ITHPDINYTFNDTNNWKYCYNAIDRINASSYGNLSICNDTNGHGTFVAGIIGGRHQGNITKCFEGYECGVAPNVTLIVIKAFEGDRTDLLYILDGINYAISMGADIISMSFGVSENVSCYDPELGILSNVIDNDVTKKEGIIAVASAGNGLYDNGTLYVKGTVFSPACSKNVIAVGSTDKQGKISDFSSRGPTDDGRTKPDLVAPGEDIRSTNLTGYGPGSGTSFSAPFVSGTVALLKEYLNKMGISMSTQEFKAVLLASTNSYGERDNIYGSGMVNATRALELINQSKYFNTNITFNHALTYKVNLTEKPAKIVIYKNSNSSENFILYAKLITSENETIYSNAYNTSDNVNEIFYNGSAGNGWLYLKLNESYDEPFTVASNVEINETPYYFIEVLSPREDIDYVATEPINITAYVFDLDGKPMNKSVNLTIYYPNGTLDRIQINSTDGYCRYLYNITGQNERVSYYTFSFNSIGENYLTETKNVTIKAIMKYKINVTGIKNNDIFLIGDERNFTIGVFDLLNEGLNISDIIVNGTILNSSGNMVDSFNSSIINYTNYSAFYFVNRTFSYTPGIYSIEIKLYNNGTLENELVLSINITNNYILNITTNITNYGVYYPNTIASFSFDVYHPNGTKMNASELNTSVYFVNESFFVNKSLGVINQHINVTNGTIELNATKAGDYYLFFNVSDSNGNYQNHTVLVHLSYFAKNLTFELDKTNYTADDTLEINVTVFENETNMSVYLANITAKLSLGGLIITNSSYTNENGSSILYLYMPFNVKDGTYTLEINATDRFGNFVYNNSESIDILTLHPVIYTNYSIPLGSNITINVTVLNYTSGLVKNSTIIANITGYIPGKLPKENSTVVYGNSTLINFTSMSSEPTTYDIKILAIDSSTGVTYRGFNTTRVYSGVAVRPSSDISKIGCEPTTISTNATRDYCVFDSKKQHDLVINPNEKFFFSALLYYGSTIDGNNYPKNVTYNLNVTNSSNGELVLNLTGNLSDNNNVTIEIPPLNKTGEYSVTVEIYENNPGEILTHEFNISVKELNVTILEPSSLDVYDINDSIKFYGIVEENGTSVADANISIESNTTEFSYACSNNNRTNSTGEFDCTLNFNELGNFSVNVSAVDNYGIEGYDVKYVSIKNLGIDITFSPTDPVNGSEITVTAKVKILPDNEWIDGGNITFKFDGSCESDTINISKDSGYEFTTKVKAIDSGECRVTVTAITKDGKLKETKTASIDVSEVQQEQRVAGGGITADLEIVEYTQKLYLKPGETNYTLVEVLAYNTEITQNVSLYVLSIPSSWYTIKPTSMLIEPDDTGIFNVTFSIPKDATLGEYTGLFKANSSYAADSKAFKIVVVGEEENETNITATAEVFYETYEEKLKVWNSTILSLKNESYNTTEIEKIYSEISKLLAELEKSIEAGNVTEMESIMTKIKQKEIEIATAFQKVEPMKEVIEKKSSRWRTISIIFGVFFIAILVYLFWPFEGKPKYDYKKGKFTWKPPREKSEIDMLWEKIKEKIQKLAS
ncbi:MAG: S8 family serine peptidase, partial [Candidatus Aenigmarchaeota archaeon]|nr:S8 family serine peptidase [Candidatus Aenigmarchaeota archaeon]